MRIGIDIDGVIADIERFIVDYGTKYCIDNNLSIEIKPGFYNESEVFNWTEEQTIKFWNEYIIYYATKYKTRDFATEIVNKLKEEGHEIYIITARNDYGVPKEYIGKMKDMVSHWLKDNDICYDKIIYTEGSKLPYCVGNYVEVMIEDSPENIKDLSSKIPVLCFDCRYNEKLEGDNITRVYTWYDVYSKIKEMEI
ncbi:MAG: hypothetical protein J6A29_00550 [Clostridia bacterium]|nr:hypothetical protein [Clostridia bacterium]